MLSFLRPFRQSVTPSFIPTLLPSSLPSFIPSKQWPVADYSALFRNKELLNKELDPRFASSAILSLALSVSQKVQGPKAPDQDPEEKCHSVIRD